MKGDYRFGVVRGSERKSLSPVMQRLFMKKLGIAGSYKSYVVPPEEYEEFVQSVRGGMLDGFNVTIPHKERTVELMDELSPDVEKIGAVNTVVRQESMLVGYNTDWRGFITALRSSGYDPLGNKALVFGAGGAARAVLYALIEAGAGEIYIRNRTAKRAAALADEFNRKTTKRIKVLKENEPTPASVSLVVSALASGVISSTEDVPLPDGIELYYDLNYFEQERRIVAELRRRGVNAHDGLNMLVYQGFISLSLWTDKEHDSEIADEVIKEIRRML